MSASVPDTATVRAGEDLDWSALERYLRHGLPELDGDFAVLQFPHGSANLTYLVTVGDTRLVVRRPPFGVLAPGAHDMAREYKVLSRLHSAYLRAPRGLLYSDDSSVIGSGFLVIEYRPGHVVRRSIPPELACGPATGHRIGMATIEALAALHTVDPASCDLDGLGRPEGYLARQVSGWTRRWAAVAAGPAAPAMAHVGQALAESVPVPQRVSILHNDFKVDNCQFAAGDPDTVTSVFDWDMATLGDPLADLGMLMNYWPQDPDRDGDPEILAASAVPGLDNLGLAPRRVILERYEQLTSLETSRLDWYEAFGCWKTAIILQQLYVRHLRGETTDPRMAERGRNVHALARKAAHLIGVRSHS